MNFKNRPARRPRLGLRVGLAVGCVVVSAGLVACGSSSSSTSTGSASAKGGSKSALGTSPGSCGTIPTVAPIDPSNVLASLTPAARANYNGFPDTVLKSPWANFQGDPKPWKIGISAGFPVMNSQTADTITEFDREFAIAKKLGLVTGSIVTDIPPSSATTTPADQIAGIERMVNEGVKGILVFPLSGPALGPVITAIGKKGVVVLPDEEALPQSPYAVGAAQAVFDRPAQGVIQAMGGKGNVLIVRGIAGVPWDTQAYTTFRRQLAQCPQIHVAGVIRGNFNNADAKTAILNFMASHPGTINGVLEEGVMTSGVISAFEQLGRPVPPISMINETAGDLAWWSAHSGYSTVAAGTNGFQQAYTMFHIMLRILDGKELKVNDIVSPPSWITSTNLDQFTVKGATPSSQAEPKAPLDGWTTDTFLNQFFKKPGQPGGNIGLTVH